MTLIIIFGVLALLLLYSMSKPKGFPPGPIRYPVVGYATSVHPTKSHITFNNLRKKYGDVVGVYMGNIPNVFVSGWDAVTEALQSNDFNGRPSSPQYIRSPDNLFSMKGIMFASGDIWKNQRRFGLHHFRNIGFGKRTHEEFILKEIVEVLDNLSSGTAPIDPRNVLGFASINIIWTFLAGIRFSYDDASLKMLVTGVFDFFRLGASPGARVLFAFPSIGPWFPEITSHNIFLEAGQNMKLVVQKAIDEHRQTFEPKVTRDFIDIYLKELLSENKDNSFSEDQLRVFCIDMMIAGSETSSSLISFCILFLCLYPDWQHKVQEELDSVIGKPGERFPSMDDKTSLPKTEAFLTEVMRYRSPSPITLPHLSTKDTVLQGHRIPKDSVLLINLRSVLMEDEYWTDPEEFRPERFIATGGTFKSNERMMIFGKGRRACLGEPLARMTSFLMFASLASRLSFRLPSGHPSIDNEGITGFTLGPPPFKVLIEKR